MSDEEAHPKIAVDPVERPSIAGRKPWHAPKLMMSEIKGETASTISHVGDGSFTNSNS